MNIIRYVRWRRSPAGREAYRVYAQAMAPQRVQAYADKYASRTVQRELLGSPRRKARAPRTLRRSR
jgi:hypothetical protein